MSTLSNSLPLSPRIERVLALDGPPFGRPRPTPEELASILGVVQEGARAAGRLNVARAIDIAADNAPDAKTAILIAGVLSDRQAGISLRRQAAASLGDIPDGNASEALTKALTAGESELEPTLLQALAKTGDEKAARAIVTRPATASASLTRLRAYARALILMRSGQALDAEAALAVFPKIETPQGLPPATRTIEITPDRPADVELAIAQFRGSTYGLRFTPAMGYRFQCGGSDHLILLSEFLAPAGRLQWLTEGRRIAGVLAMRAEQREGAYAARRVVVTQPTKDGIQVSVLRPDGDVELTGLLTPSSRDHVLRLQSRAGSRLPTVVEGTLTDDRLRLQIRIAGASATGKRPGDVDSAAT